MRNLHFWWMASRPATLLASAAPVWVGSALAFRQGVFDGRVLALCLIGAGGLQILSNWVNDAADFEHGTDNEHRIGPVRAAQSGLIAPAQLWKASSQLALLCVLVGLILAVVSGPWVIVVGMLSLIGAYSYTAGPALGYKGLGDLMVWAYFGYVAVGGTIYAHANAVISNIAASQVLDPAAFACATAIGLLAVSILVVNNIRDREGDRIHHKRTVVVRFGYRFGLLQYFFAVLGAFACAVYVAIFHIQPVFWVMILLPLGIANMYRVWSSDGPQLNPLLGASARLLALFSVVLSLAIIGGR